VNARAATLALVLTAVGAVGGCASTPSSAPAKHAASAPSAATSPAASSPSPMVTPTAPASTSLGAGERVWAAFSESGLSQDAWWKQLSPLLSDSARAVYVYDDPQNLPEMKLTGTIHLAVKPPAEPRFTAEVVVPTSKGTFALDLERHTLKSRWLLYSITFPHGVK
jgi:hypothetical protein